MASWHWVPQHPCSDVLGVFRQEGEQLLVSSRRFWGATGAGCQPQGGPAEIQLPALVVAGLGLSQASPCCCLGPSQPPPALEWPPQTQEGRRVGTVGEWWCHTGQRCALTQLWELWLGCGGPGWHRLSTSLCCGPCARVPWWDVPTAGACPGDGCCGDGLLPHNRLCLVLSPSPRTVWRCLDQY